MEKLDFIDSKFRLAILAAKRAKQLVAGAKKKVDSYADNPLTVAIQEIYQGKIKFKILDDEELFYDSDDSPSILLGSESEAAEYESDGDVLLHTEDEDSDDYHSEIF